MKNQNEAEYIRLSIEADEKFSSGKKEEAGKLLQTGFALAEKNGDAAFIEFFKGELEFIKENYETSLSHHKRAVALEHGNPFLLKNLGVCYSVCNKEEEAIEWFDKALLVKPDDYDSLRNKGVSLSKMDKQEEAIECFDKALLVKPDDFRSLTFKAYLLEKTGKITESKGIIFSLNEIIETIKDKEIADYIKFKAAHYKTKESGQTDVTGKSSDVLNKVISIFSLKKKIYSIALKRLRLTLKNLPMCAGASRKTILPFYRFCVSGIRTHPSSLQKKEIIREAVISFSTKVKGW